MRKSRLQKIFILFVGFLSLLYGEVSYRYSYIPKKVYIHQVFPVTVLAQNAISAPTPTFRFDPQSNIKPIESKPLKIANGKDFFYTFYFKAKETDFRLPDLWIEDDNQSIRLTGEIIPVYRLTPPPEDRFCGVIASDFKIKNSQISTFDENNNLIYLSIEATEANLEDMHIPGVVEDGIEKFNRLGAKANAEYYFVIPANVSSIQFSYFNPINHKFILKKVSTSYHFNTVAAQVDLNPKDSSFNRLKKYTFIALSIIFLIILIFTRDILYIILFIASVVTLITFYAPLKKVCIKEGTPLYILPFNGSTVGTVISKQIEVPIYHKYRNYYKIQYLHGITGWIKDDDVCKN